MMPRSSRVSSSAMVRIKPGRGFLLATGTRQIAFAGIVQRPEWLIAETFAPIAENHRVGLCWQISDVILAEQGEGATRNLFASGLGQAGLDIAGERVGFLPSVSRCLPPSQIVPALQQA